MAQAGKVSNTVSQLRRQAKITQEELGLAVGVTRQTVISIEKGNYVPSVLLAMNPARATIGSAGCDLRAYLRGRRVRTSDGHAHGEREATNEGGEWSLTISPREMALVPLGFRTRLPEGIEAQIRPRSGLALKYGITLPNSPATIDPGYRGEIKVIVQNLGRVQFTIEPGERIAQMVIARYEAIEWEEGELGESQRGEGGFGSSGR